MEERELADYLKKNIQLFGGAMLECSTYFTDHTILPKEDAEEFTVETISFFQYYSSNPKNDGTFL